MWRKFALCASGVFSLLSMWNFTKWFQGLIIAMWKYEKYRELLEYIISCANDFCNQSIAMD